MKEQHRLTIYSHIGQMPSVRQGDFGEAEAAGHTWHSPGAVNTGTLFEIRA
ncbi:hypothetical protein [Paenibacillus polymyxa]|uniref:hypothetical protein n=1 Tax=Paenibacillus polymyxa TaxID=1406 RepID=UPI0013765D0E|nr:hypothetical protein [Paenibacillus polymyxa]